MWPSGRVEALLDSADFVSNAYFIGIGKMKIFPVGGSAEIQGK